MFVESIAVDGADGDAGAIGLADDGVNGVAGIGVGVEVVSKVDDQLAAGDLALGAGECEQRGQGRVGVLVFEDALRFFQTGDQKACAGAVGRVDGERVALGHGDEVLFRGAEAGIGDGGVGNGGREDGFFDEVVVNGIGLNEAQATVHLKNGEE